MVPLVAALRRDARRAVQAGPRLETMADRINQMEASDARLRARLAHGRRFIARRQADIDFAASQGLSWRGGAVLAWAGMRGVITLAAAQTLPRDLPYRPQLVLVAFTVALATLLLHGSTLPAVIKRLRLRGTDAEAHREELASLLEEITQAGLAAISDEALATAGEQIDPEVLERVRNEAKLRVVAAREAGAAGTYAQYRALRRRALDAERGALLEARSIGARSSGVLAEAQALLDQEESRIWRDPGH